MVRSRLGDTKGDRDRGCVSDWQHASYDPEPEAARYLLDLWLLAYTPSAASKERAALPQPA